MCDCSCDCWDRLFVQSLKALPKAEQERAFAEIMADLERNSDLMRRLMADETPISGGPITIPIEYA